MCELRRQTTEATEEEEEEEDERDHARKTKTPHIDVEKNMMCVMARCKSSGGALQWLRKS